jgi:hypothetical protein
VTRRRDHNFAYIETDMNTGERSHVECPTCHGTGMQPCFVCDGTGCAFCEGGENECEDCDGAEIISAELARELLEDE